MYNNTGIIIINYAQVSTVNNTNLTNFPLLFSGTYAYLATVAHGGSIYNNNGYDITFSSDQAGNSLLNWEIEYYNPATGQIVAWIKIPAVSASIDTAIYFHYGNTLTASFQGGATGAAWDSNFVGVYHLANGTTLSTNDSTSNGNNGSNANITATSGKIDGAGSFNGTSSIMEIDSVAASLQATDFTFSAWVNFTTISASCPIICLGDSASYNDIFLAYYGQDGNMDIDFETNTTVWVFTDAGWSPTTGIWYYLAGTYANSTGVSALYINGIQQASKSGSASRATSSGYSTHAAIGYNVSTPAYFPGAIDEARLSTSARSADWIITEYNNQNNPSTFYSVIPSLGFFSPRWVSV